MSGVMRELGPIPLFCFINTFVVWSCRSAADVFLLPQERKKAAKAEAKERRQNKMPKAEKKRLMKRSRA